MNSGSNYLPNLSCKSDVAQVSKTEPSFSPTRSPFCIPCLVPGTLDISPGKLDTGESLSRPLPWPILPTQLHVLRTFLVSQLSCHCFLSTLSYCLHGCCLGPGFSSCHSSCEQFPDWSFTSRLSGLSPVRLITDFIALSNGCFAVNKISQETSV